MLQNISNTEDALIEEILKRWQPRSSRCGRLVQRSDSVLHWHYSVALSDASAIGWWPERSGCLSDRGRLAIEKLGDNFHDALKVPYLNHSEILTNLIASVPAFHEEWNYGVQGWNCEHWARLVTTGKPISYQIKTQGFGIFDLFGTLHNRGEAIAHLNGYRDYATQRICAISDNA
jgi:hypothetical protein